MMKKVQKKKVIIENKTYFIEKYCSTEEKKLIAEHKGLNQFLKDTYVENPGRYLISKKKNMRAAYLLKKLEENIELKQEDKEELSDIAEIFQRFFSRTVGEIWLIYNKENDKIPIGVLEINYSIKRKDKTFGNILAKIKKRIGKNEYDVITMFIREFFKNNIGYINFIQIHPEFQRNKIAQYLFKEAEKLFKDKNKIGIMLFTQPEHKKAIEFYKKLEYSFIPKDPETVEKHDNLIAWKKF